ALALYLFPLIGHALELTPSQFAVWAAIAIHDTSSVVGAAAGYGDQALAEATVLKLARALWIVPLVVLFMLSSRTSGRAGRITWPIFVALFIAAAALRGLLPELESSFDQLAALARRGLVLTLFLIGAGLTPALLRNLGWKPMVYSALLWVLVSGATLLLILA
ncbi:MAG: putative sulfate exporter family transporter, partial [Wenzhouxiangellaceae bacterium]